MISVLILHYGDIAHTRRCLRSVLRARHDDAEILVLDNGSSGNDATSLREEFPDVRIFRSDRNLGFAGGGNFLADAAAGEILVFLNNDAEVTDDWLAPLIAALEDPSVAAAQSKLLSLRDPSMFDDGGACGGFLDALGFPYTRGRLFATVEPDRGQYDDPCDIHWACGAAFAVRKSLFMEAEGFEARFFAYLEEVDLCLTLSRRGYRIVSAPASVVYHRGGEAWRDRPFRKRYHQHRNSILVLLKHLSARQLVVVLPVRIVLECAASAYYLCSGQRRSALAPLCALAGALRHAGHMFRSRQPGLRPFRADIRSCAVEYFLFGRRTWNRLSTHAVSGNRRMNKPHAAQNAPIHQRDTIPAAPRKLPAAVHA